MTVALVMWLPKLVEVANPNIQPEMPPTVSLPQLV